MRPIFGKLAVSSLLGLFFVLVGTLRAEGQTNWQTDPARATHYTEGFAPPRTRLPATLSPHPLGSTGSPATAQGVIQADYQAPSGAVASPQSAPGPFANPDRRNPTSTESQETVSRGEKISKTLKSKNSDDSNRRFPGGLSLILTTGGALAFVLGLFFIVAWCLRRAAPKTAVALPAEVVEVLGRVPLTNRQHAQLLRVGNKILLVCVRTDGAETLTEITDPVEVDRLAELCRQSQPAGVKTAFRQVFDQFGGKPAASVAVVERPQRSYSYRDTQARALEGRDV